MTTDASVPEEHRGLHSALYGDSAAGGEAAHRAAELDAAAAHWPGRLDGSELLPLAGWLEAVAAAAKIAEPPRIAVGLYALYNDDSDEASARPWHVGYSRRVQGDLLRWQQSAKAPRFARVRLLGTSPKMWTRARLEDVRRSWAEELGLVAEDLAAVFANVPVGQGAALSAEEQRAFEEQKWKMELAMGKNLDDAVAGEEVSDRERRQRFLRAVEGDDWSSVVNEQTAQTMGNQAVGPADGHAGPRFSSPFERAMATPTGTAADTVEVPRELTVENIEAVLKPLRPVLLADGGDIEVLGVNPGRSVVMLGLLGACTTCPAAPATMEGGIEKALHDHFGPEVEVVRVDSGAAASSEEGLRLSVEAHLGTLQESLERDGAVARLLPSEGDGRLEVEFSGQAMLFQLVQSSLSYRFPELAGRLRVRQAAEAPVPSAVAAA